MDIYIYYTILAVLLFLYWKVVKYEDSERTKTMKITSAGLKAYYSDQGRDYFSNQERRNE